jgi:hypothetical protein
MKDRFDIFGTRPDVIDDDWIDDEERLEEELKNFTNRRARANAFDLRYAGDVVPKDERWELCEKVLARNDVKKRLSRGWGERERADAQACQLAQHGRDRDRRAPRPVPGSQNRRSQAPHQRNRRMGATRTIGDLADGASGGDGSTVRGNPFKTKNETDADGADANHALSICRGKRLESSYECGSIHQGGTCCRHPALDRRAGASEEGVVNSCVRQRQGRFGCAPVAHQGVHLSYRG